LPALGRDKPCPYPRLLKINFGGVENMKERRRYVKTVVPSQSEVGLNRIQFVA
jgi:hypothetical protein